MATVEVTFTPLPVHVRTARLVATAVARRSGVAESLLDEVRLAVGEACSRAVEAHQRHCPGEPIRVSLTDDGEQFQVVVTDAVPGSERDLPAGVEPRRRRGPVPRAATARPSAPTSRCPSGGVRFRCGSRRTWAWPSSPAWPTTFASRPAGRGTSVTMIWKRRTAAF